MRNPSHLAISCGGRFGRRRVRVNQCWLILRAEETYDAIPESVTKEHHTFTVRCDGGQWRVTAELRPNPIWRLGRLFYRCSQCGNLATRLYVPRPELDMRCRTCWGLSYESKSWSYHGGFMGWARDICLSATEARREVRRLRSLHRRSQRRRIR